MTVRGTGLLLHPTSLPGRFGIGDLGPSADAFLGWAEAAGATIWQVLPLGPAGYYGSPYDGHSAFAGNPLLISPERLIEDGSAPSSVLGGAPGGSGPAPNDAAAVAWRERVLRLSREHFLREASPADREQFRSFVEAPAQRGWLEDWALYAALKARFGGRPWGEWPREIAARDPGAIESARRDLAGEIEFEKYLQFLFFRQWGRVKQEANRRGILIMGDLPIYVALDSADVWTNRHLFTVGADGTPERAAGVPPDYFSSTGQRWGNPLYRWDRMEEASYEWWVERLRANLGTADLVRIDHFRGFAAFWSIPASEPTAINGEWVPGPGIKLFDALRAALGELPIVAEDLGVITPDVDELRAAIGCPGMRVLQFAFSETDSPHLPHRHVPNCVVYTGTHDNDTTRGWFEKAGKEERRRALDYLGGDGREIEWDLSRAALTSVADTAIVPVQDVLGLGSEARMNTPGRVEGNWRWRLGPHDLDPGRAARLRRLGELTGRLPGGARS